MSYIVSWCLEGGLLSSPRCQFLVLIVEHQPPVVSPSPPSACLALLYLGIGPPGVSSNVQTSMHKPLKDGFGSSLSWSGPWITCLVSFASNIPQPIGIVPYTLLGYPVCPYKLSSTSHRLLHLII
ncbi:hypothetical protein QAD02_013286 [Eretmocerus hayati]|uniref:Uncharacterized protein n=2 Tax=Eretmocerus hayati TaxID=131215 RepID=A0ACC2P243_9HYME|nr:hypothetical protein QAD02_013283 [Eretmocerus hayati]KAJ8677499.1 hypothetical protein QAD02_013286 [Eretmocerus hayati]